MHGISVWRKGIHRPGGQFCLNPVPVDGAPPSGSRAGSGGAHFSASVAAIVRRSDGRTVDGRCLDSWRVLFFFFFPLPFFRDRAALMKSGHEWTIDSVHVAGGNFSPKCRAYEYGYFESVVREIRRCNWKRRMFSEVCFFFLFFCISFFFFSVDYLVAFREIIVRFEDSRRDCYLDCV